MLRRFSKFSVPLFGAIFCLLGSALQAEDMVPLKLKLPAPVFSGTPKNAPPGMSVEEASAQKTLMVPADVRNLAPGKKITCSDKSITESLLSKLTDGDKEAEESSVMSMHKGLQWVQFDLGAPKEIYAVVIWHAFDTAKIYRSVIVQVADDSDFSENVHILFNNDTDNSAGLGMGTNRPYFESNLGKVVDAKGARARYVRLYSHGSTDGAFNEYTEVEIYGRPPK
jgi:hypothetical protein